MPRRRIPEKRKSSNNTLWIVLSVVGAIVVVGALVWFASNSATEQVATPKAATGKTLGVAGAPVVIEEYADFQ